MAEDSLPTAEEYALFREAYAETYPVRPLLNAIAAKDATRKLWLAITNLDPNQAAEVEASLAGINAKSAVGETLTAQKVDSVNTFDAPNAVVPKSFVGKIQGSKLALKLEPKSVTVLSVE